MAFASNKNAYGICDITGFRYKRKDMKKNLGWSNSRT